MNRNRKATADAEFQRIYKAYYRSIYKFCYSKLLDDTSAVDDIMQEAFIILYNRLLNGEEVEYVYAFMLKTADNLIQQHYRELKKANRNISLDEIIKLPSQNDSLDERVAFEQYSKEFSAALRDDEAELFSMRYIEELEINEIAELTGMTITNISTRLHRIREKLRKLYGEDFNYR